MSKSHFVVKPSKLAGEIQVPSSKSQTLRALCFALLAKGKSVIKNALLSPDVRHMIEACRHFGAEVTVRSNEMDVEGLNGNVGMAEDVIDVGNSGIILRFLGAISSLSSYPIVFTGDQSILQRRSVAPLLEGLNQLGATASSLKDNGLAPFMVRGPLKGGHAIVDGEDSQPVSGLLLAAAFASAPSDIFVLNPGERPFVAMTLSWFDRLGISYQAHRFSHYRLHGRANIEGFSYTVPGDFSSLAFPMAAALVTGSSLTCGNLDFTDAQGDKKVINHLQAMTASVLVNNDTGFVEVDGAYPLQGQKIDVNDCIDALPILAVLGCFAEGETFLTGAQIARQKESNRLEAMTTMLKKMGADIAEHADGLIIRKSNLKGTRVGCLDDHRVAMALTVAALGATGESVIEGVQCIAKSYPGFFDHLKNVGACIECLSS